MYLRNFLTVKTVTSEPVLKPLASVSIISMGIFLSFIWFSALSQRESQEIFYYNPG